MVKTGLYLILGEPGAGKSSFMYANVITEMFNKDRYREAKRITNELVFGGYTNLELPPKHVCYTEYFVQSCLVGKPKYSTYECSAKKFGIPNDIQKTDFYPPCSVLGFDEAQRTIDNRNWKSLPDYLKRSWETHRHIEYCIFYVTQFGNVDKVLRELASGIYYIRSKYQCWSKDKYPHLQSCWTYSFFNNWEEFLNCYSKNEFGKEETFVFDGNIKKSYDGEVYRALWLRNREKDNFSQKLNKPVEHTVDGYNEFLKVLGEIS